MTHPRVMDYDCVTYYPNPSSNMTVRSYDPDKEFLVSKQLTLTCWYAWVKVMTYPWVVTGCKPKRLSYLDGWVSLRVTVRCVQSRGARLVI